MKLGERVFVYLLIYYAQVGPVMYLAQSMPWRTAICIAFTFALSGWQAVSLGRWLFNLEGGE